MSGTFSVIAKGTKAIRRVGFTTISGVEATCGVRVLLDVHDDAIETAARAAAVARGADPKPGDVIYDRWVRLFTLLYACVSVPDTESEPIADDPPLFFDGGIEQIQTHLDRERIAYLFALQEQWQALVSPRPRNMTRDEYAAHVFRMAMAEVGDDELPFWHWHPALLESFVITSCGLLMSSHVLRSAYGLDSGPNATSSSPTSEAGENPTPDAARRIIDESLDRGAAHAARRGGRVHETSVGPAPAANHGARPRAPARTPKKLRARAKR